MRKVCVCKNVIETNKNRKAKRKISLREVRKNKLGQWVCLTCGKIHQ